MFLLPLYLTLRVQLFGLSPGKLWPRSLSGWSAVDNFCRLDGASWRCVLVVFWFHRLVTRNVDVGVVLCVSDWSPVWSLSE